MTDAVTVPRELLLRAAAIIDDDVAAIGGCDHAVNICCCEMKRTARELRHRTHLRPETGCEECDELIRAGAAAMSRT